MFNVQNDPQEMHDLSEKEPARVKELLTLLTQLQKSNDDKAPLVVEKLDDPSVTLEKLAEQAKALERYIQEVPAEDNDQMTELKVVG